MQEHPRLLCASCHRYRKIYEDYKAEYSYWKLLLIGRKLCFACIVVLLNYNVDAQYARTSKLAPFPFPCGCLFTAQSTCLSGPA